MTQDFETYLQQARTEFCLVAHKYDVTHHGELRTAIDSLLIAYDQAFLALRKHSVSGKRLLSIEWQANETIERLTTLINEVDELKAACASGMQIKVPTAQEYIDFMKKQYSDETDERKSSEEQP